MYTVTELKGSDLWAVKIAVGFSKYTLLKDGIKCDFPSGSWFIYDFPNGDDFKIVGIVTKDEVLFDCHPIVDKELKSLGYQYLNYTLPETEKRPYKFGSAHESLRSLLEVNNVHWVNPIGAKPVFKYSDYEFGNEGLTESMQASIEDDFQQTHNDWQTAENNLIGNNNILILKKVK